MKSTAVLGAIGILLALGAARMEAQQPAFRVTDLNTSHPSPRFFNPFTESEAVNGLFYFVEDDGIHGRELWVSDGSTAGTRLVADLCPGSCPSYPRYLLASPDRNLLFFNADDGAHGEELWQTDGTSAGTRMVTSLVGIPNNRIGPYFEHDGFLFFTADDPLQGYELWRWDGTFGPSSILLTMDITPAPRHGSNTKVLAASGDKLLVAAASHENSGLSLGLEPWVLSGPCYCNNEVFLGDLNPWNGSSVYYGFDPPTEKAVGAPWGGFVFLADDGSHGLEVWKTDGTPGGTSLLKDVSAGATSSSPHELRVLGGAVYFVATDPQNGTELWRTDGTAAGTVLVRDVQPGSGGSRPFGFTLWGNRLFFHADDGVHGIELWVTDGTTAGTVLVKDVQPGPSGSFGAEWLHSGLSLVGDRLLFFALDPAGVRLWRSDGTTAGTVPVDPPSQSGAWPYSDSVFFEDGFGVAGGSLYFRGDTPGDEIWRTDGTAAGTVRIKDVDETTSAFFMTVGLVTDSFGTLGGNVFFQATDGSSGLELWGSDGTEAGTELVADLRPGLSSSLPHQLRAVGNRLVFSAFASPAGVWSTDGTPGGTQSLVSVLDSLPWEIGVGGGNAFFTAGSSDNGGKLWKTDGTPAGTLPLVPLFPGSGSSLPTEFEEVGSKIYFPFTDSAGTELWASDGTVPGTYRVANINPELPPGFPQDSNPSNLTRVGNLLFFSAYKGNLGEELWKSDGTAGGTVLVKDIHPGSSSIPFSAETDVFAAVGGLLLFVADDGQSGLELWRSDGTEAGTVLVKDIHPGPSHSYPQQLTSVGDQVYFTAEDALHGRELWVSDGTEAGTHLVEDILPGTGSSRPGNLTAVDSRTLLFSAFDSLGVEPWRSSGTPLGTRRLADIAPGALSSSPARFTAAGANVYFVANDNATGFELWGLPKAFVHATFGDVPTTYWASPYVEALADAGLTTGCGDGLYCPTQSVARAEMAVFVLRVIHGAGYVPPDVSTSRFADVPASHWALDWIEQLATEGITSGCGVSPAMFCPESPTARDQMAVFLLRALHGAGYTPPPATGTVFTDVPASYWAAAWIEQLAAEGITSGCAANLYCPGDPVSREQMAVFLTRALDLPLP